MKKQKKKGVCHYGRNSYQEHAHDSDRVARRNQNLCACNQRKMICHTRNQNGRRQ